MSETKSIATGHKQFVERRVQQTTDIKRLKGIAKSSKVRMARIKKQACGVVGYHEWKKERMWAKSELQRVKQEREANLMDYLFMLLNNSNLVKDFDEPVVHEEIQEEVKPCD